MELKTTKVYVPVKKIEEHSLIEEAISDIFTIFSLNDIETAKKLISSQFLVMNNLDYEKKELYPLTKKELERVIEDAFEAGELYGNPLKFITEEDGKGGYVQRSKNITRKKYINQILE